MDWQAGSKIMPKSSETVITKGIVDACSPAGKRYDIWDSKLPGFGLRIGISGSKTYVVRYRADGGGRSAPKRYVTVGRHGALTVEQARKKAEQVARLVQGTSALESQAVDAKTYKRLVEKTYHELLAGSRRRLWSA